MIQSPTTQTPISRHMSVTDFAHYGAQDFAYIKRVVVNGDHVFAVFAADGQELALIDGLDLAIATVRQNDMEPLSVH